MPIARLRNQVQHYAWGSRTFIPELQGRPASGKPEAELWMGAHPAAPSRASVGTSEVPLDRLIESEPATWLGRSAAHFAQRLPFLLKVLAAESPLSLQAHPDQHRAHHGYHGEEARNIPKDHPSRKYRDPHHKPELLCALTPFQALVGFREWDAVRRLARELGSGLLQSRVNAVEHEGGHNLGIRLFSSLLQASSGDRSMLVQETVAACRARSHYDTEFSRSFAWAARLHEVYPSDIGVVTQLLLNLVELEPGQALFLPPGQLHAYLDGAGIEIMASSDNVLRGGLTPKPVHTEELLSILEGAPQKPALQTGAVRHSAERVLERAYEAEAHEFELSRVELSKASWQPTVSSPEIWLCLEGEASISYDEQRATLSKGESVIISGDTPGVQVTGNGVFFRAKVGNVPFR